MATTATITVQNKKYEYTIKPSDCEAGTIRFVCKVAKINQNFLAADIQALINLPKLIVTERAYQTNQTNQSEIVRFRISAADKQKISEKALAGGFDSVSDYLRSLALV